MSFVVLFENITVIALVIVVMLSIVQKIEFKRNLFICLIFYVGLAGQYFLKEQQLSVIWFLFFASISFIGMAGVTIIKLENINKIDMFLIGLFFTGIPRNWIMHYDRYFSGAEFFASTYVISGILVDATIVLLIIWPLVKNLIGAIFKRRSKDGLTAH